MRRTPTGNLLLDPPEPPPVDEYGGWLIHGVVQLGGHGSDAAGQADPRFRIFPMLRGQHADYVIAKLKEYRSGALADSSTDFIMQGVARTLDDASIEAVARYLAALSPQNSR